MAWAVVSPIRAQYTPTGCWLVAELLQPRAPAGSRGFAAGIPVIVSATVNGSGLTMRRPIRIMTMRRATGAVTMGAGPVARVVIAPTIVMIAAMARIVPTMVAAPVVPVVAAAVPVVIVVGNTEDDTAPMPARIPAEIARRVADVHP